MRPKNGLLDAKNVQFFVLTTEITAIYSVRVNSNNLPI